MSLVISIILTNLLLSMNYFVVEGLQSLIEDSIGPPISPATTLQNLQSSDAVALAM